MERLVEERSVRERNVKKTYKLEKLNIGINENGEPIMSLPWIGLVVEIPKTLQVNYCLENIGKMEINFFDLTTPNTPNLTLKFHGDQGFVEVSFSLDVVRKLIEFVKEVENEGGC